ncbi:MAG: hypothetical protein FWC54_01395, partial [Actinomycetia bacterium]|nr:hypothetical protein [Actinomycetes bacterium]
TSKSVTIKATVLASAAGTTLLNTAIATSDDPEPITSDPNETPIDAGATVVIRYHLLTADGSVIATDTFSDLVLGAALDPTLYLDAHKPYGYGHGVAAEPASWVIHSASQTFDVYYPNTAPTINVEREVLYFRKPARLSLADLLRVAGVTITDVEETIPLSALQVAGYDNITWDLVNYGDGAYVLTLNVSDTPGFAAPVRQIAIFVEPEATKVTPIDPDDPAYPDLPWLPEPLKWGFDENDNPIIYLPSPTPAPLAALPKTGDVAYVETPLFVAAVGLFLTLLAFRRQSEQAWNQ